jgi:rhodanese-related sulfurtransferase
MLEQKKNILHPSPAATCPAATLIDVREYPEFAAASIPGSRLVPLGTIAQVSRGWDPASPLLLICKSGRRAEQARSRLAAEGFTALTVLDGGIDAWIAAGNPIASIARRPWSIERQVRAAAGSLVLLTLALAWTVSRYFLLGTAFVGAGLVFAGVSDICLMASLLGRLPWNRPSARSRCSA